MDPINRVPNSQSLSEIQKSIEALTNIVFVIRQTAYDSQELEIYLRLAEKELERLTKIVRVQFKGVHN